MSEGVKGRRRAASRRSRARLAGLEADIHDDRDPRRSALRRRSPRAVGRRRLFTASVALAYDRAVMLGFHASVARDESEVRRRLCSHLGEVAAGFARITEGYDERSFIARTVVTPSLRELLRTVEEAPYGSTADGFEIQHVQFVGVEP